MPCRMPRAGSRRRLQALRVGRWTTNIVKHVQKRRFRRESVFLGARTGNCRDCGSLRQLTVIPLS